MRPWIFSAAGTCAVPGFLLSLVSSTAIALFIVLGRGECQSPAFFVSYLSIVPILLMAGLFLSFKSVLPVQGRGEMDYAAAGLILNILFAFIYFISAKYYIG